MKISFFSYVACMSGRSTVQKGSIEEELILESCFTVFFLFSAVSCRPFDLGPDVTTMAGTCDTCCGLVPLTRLCHPLTTGSC